MNRTVKMRIVQGVTYRYHDTRVVERDGTRLVDDVEGAPAVVNGFCRDVLTRNEVVIFTPSEGPDQGQMFCCAQDWFATHFRPIPVEPPAQEKPEAAPPLPEKVAGAKEGSGY